MMCPSRPIEWIGTSRADYMRFPPRVHDDFGFSLWLLQMGDTPSNAKPLKGFGGSSVLELIDDFRGDAYRVVITVRIRDKICVLHCFQKKSSTGIKTSQQDLDLVRKPLAQAEREFKSELQRLRRHGVCGPRRNARQGSNRSSHAPRHSAP